MKNDVKNFRGEMLSLDKERQINYISKDDAMIKGNVIDQRGVRNENQQDQRNAVHGPVCC
jgi:hypothetical protein